MMILIGIFTGIAYRHAQQGKTYPIRPLEALEAIHEHIGRAAELGTPVFDSVGMGGISAVTLAGMSVLGEVAQRAAEIGVETYTVTMRPQATIVAESIMRQALTAGGKADWYVPGKYVKWFGFEWFTFSSGAAALLLEYKPALCIYIGSHTNELTQILETGARYGAVQVGGLSGSAYSVPMAMFADYLAIGAEQYAIGAAISQDPMAMGTLAAEDWTKLVILAIMVAGVLFALVGSDLFIKLVGL
jgi:hypothetical protein